MARERRHRPYYLKRKLLQRRTARRNLHRSSSWITNGPIKCIEQMKQRIQASASAKLKQEQRQLALLLHEGSVVDCGNHLKDAKVCRQARDSHIVAVHTGEEIYVYNLRKKNKPDKKKDPNDKTPVQKYTPRKYVFPGLASACIDSTGVLAYAVDNRGKLARLLLSQKDDTYGPNYESTTVAPRHRNSNWSSAQRRRLCSLVLRRVDSKTMQCLVFSVSQNRLLYTCHDVEGFPHNAYPLRAEFDDTTFKMVGQNESKVGARRLP
jgi:hypothetical protein